ncbi:M13 family peptidase [Mycoplasmopsis mucosicanis]|uniref:M13 family peptidase n=1 Tax=Mycoplasmopsis mucosicanis TaxID=458208 RepID=A0A507SKG9_9BACT|nr:M13-type metalloendopeptidase [Mycoplasmopsis mucosicanis]TQC51436.1 M13 family peptidase [Mycoplasmopsis mucosicanis]
MNKYKIQDNLFRAVNEQWLEEAKIPEDKSATGEFEELYRANEKTLSLLAQNLVKKLHEDKLQDKSLVNFAKFYSLMSDFETRKTQKTAPLKPFVQEILQTKDIEELKNKYPSYIKKQYPVPIDFGVSNDFLDSTIMTLYADIAPHILPNKAHYDNAEIKSKFLKVYKDMVKKLLKPYIDDAKEINKLVKLTLQFDEIIAKYSLSSEQKVRYNELYKPQKLEKIAKKTKYFDFNYVVNKLITKPVDQVVFSNEEFAFNIDKIFNPKHFDKIIAWMSVKFIVKYSHLLDEKTRNLAAKYSLFISGQQKVANKKKHALQSSLSYFKMPIGLYFGKKYFGARAKKDVETMVQHMIDIYKEKLTNNDWLSKETIEKAILKLSTLGVHIGYPNELKPYYEDLSVESTSIIGTVLKFNDIVSQYNFSEYKEPINKNYWGMAPYEVNAYYHPMYNHIVFPAGILNGAFYSLKHTTSENYGAIGAVIAHEISHAFDNNGANFDEKGNLKMWWTAEDFEKFAQKTKQMIELFNGVETDFGKCNGTLTVSENIADAGGLSTALAAAKLEKDFDAKQFYSSWARAWKSKFRAEYAKRLLENDPHAPTELRANIQAANQEDFYEAFNVQSSDKMFIEPSKRVKIW